jgi:TfoX/Sxy family transcriptional regulator of competence genes
MSDRRVRIGLMPYDETLADRVRKLIGDDPGYVEKRMFRGLAMMLDGNMAVCVNPTGLLVRIDPATQERVLSEPGVRRFVMGERPMKGWVEVDTGAIATPAALRRWVRRGADYARSLPSK